MTISRFSRTLAGLTLILLSACGGDRPGPSEPVPLGPGPMAIRITDRPEDLRILRLVISGPILDITPALHHHVWQRNHYDGTRTVVVYGALEAGVIAHFESGNRDAEFSVAVTGAATGEPGGYELLPVSAVGVVLQAE